MPGTKKKSTPFGKKLPVLRILNKNTTARY
jgi:hypothetical protein